MACINAYNIKTAITQINMDQTPAKEPYVDRNVDKLLFGADSKNCGSDLLQNNIDAFEWIVRNKIYPNFYGRYIGGDYGLTKGEIAFIHSKGCKIAAIYADNSEKRTEKQGILMADKLDKPTIELGIPEGTAIFLELDENETISRNFLKGFAESLIAMGYTPGFKANTDARFAFDREFSGGMRTDSNVFKKCLIWAVSPVIEDYNRLTTSHLIHPDNWAPYAPSALTRNEIAVWQYGRDCHPIEDNEGKLTFFNLDLVRNEQVILDKMF